VSDRKVPSNYAGMVSGRRGLGSGGNAEKKKEPNKDGGCGDASKSKKHQKKGKHHKKNTRERGVGPSAREMQRQDLRGALHRVPPEGEYAHSGLGRSPLREGSCQTPLLGERSHHTSGSSESRRMLAFVNRELEGIADVRVSDEATIAREV
jgi:hypothetical protein